VKCAYFRLCSAKATGIWVIRAQYLADGRSRLERVMTRQCKMSVVLIAVAVKSSNGGIQCRCFLTCVVSLIGVSHVRDDEGRC